MNSNRYPKAVSCTGACVAPAALRGKLGLAAHTRVFKALADETRLRILEQLAMAGSPLCACHIESCCDLAQPTVSHHLKVLREAGLIVGERRGTWIYYSLNLETVGALPELLTRLVPSLTHTPSAQPAG